MQERFTDFCYLILSNLRRVPQESRRLCELLASAYRSITISVTLIRNNKYYLDEVRRAVAD